MEEKMLTTIYTNLNNLLRKTYEEKNKEYIDLKISSFEYKPALMFIVYTLISDKVLFARNAEAYDFINRLLNVKFKDYIVKNRSLLIGKTMKELDSINHMLDLEDYLSACNRFILKTTSSEYKNHLDVFRRI